MANNGSRRKNNRKKSGNHDALGMTLVVISAFLLLCIIIKPILGVFSEAIFAVMLGVFGIFSYPFLIFTLLLGVFILLRRSLNASKRVVVCVPLLVVFSLVILQLATTHGFLNDGFSDYIENVYKCKFSAGGVIMGVVAYGLKALITEIACYVVFSVAVLITVAVMTSAVPRIRDSIAKRKTRKAPPEPAPKPYSMFSDEDPRMVVSANAGPRGGLYVGTIERTRDYDTETGIASEAPVSVRRKVSDYAPTHVMDGSARDEEETRNSARYRLYGDSKEITRQKAEDFMATSGSAHSADDVVRETDFADGIAEPYRRVNEDAVNPDRMQRIDYDGMPGSLAEIYFPSQKEIEFNDVGIENADEMNSRDRERRGAQAEFERATAPVFDVPRPSRTRDFSVETIIDASAPIEPVAPPPPIVHGETVAPSPDDRFLSAFNEERKTPPLETERFKQEDIIDAYEVRSRYAEPEPQPEPEEDYREDIVVASNPAEQSADDGFVDPVRDDFDLDITNADDGIIEGGLVISDEPAVDMSETHDNVSDIISGGDLSGMYVSADKPTEKPAQQKPAGKNAPLPNQMSIGDINKQNVSSVAFDEGKQYRKYPNYQPPPLDLLKVYEKHELSQEELNMRARALEDVVTDVIVPGNGKNMKEQIREQVKVLEIVPGPQVTRYELEVPSGVNVSLIESRSATIAYELAADGGIRVQAPIPGKRAIGIEVPNATRSIVGLREIVKSDTFIKDKSPYTFAVGKDIGGAVITCDLDKAPHFLIAGQTGSGKSACLNSLIVSLLYKTSPEDVRLILIDPKRVEFPRYRGMPHMLFENVITDSRDAIKSLKWATKEMDRRYSVLGKYNCSKISEYNALPEVKSGKINKLPHIIIIIDELASLMQSSKSAGNEIEGLISSIVALARAAGLHLIVATQRPSIDVITGTIKANLGSRIALRVADANNSRIIIDENGAEALAGDGDMLFFPVNYLASKRVQGSYVSGEEIVSVVNYLKNNYECDFDEEAEKFVCGGGDTGSGGMGGGSGDGDGGNGLDPLASRVLAHGIKTKQLSVSVVQRRFSIGYARAARIIDSFEENNYIGPSTGNSKPRDVLMTPEEYRNVFGHDIEDS